MRRESMHRGLEGLAVFLLIAAQGLWIGAIGPGVALGLVLGGLAWASGAMHRSPALAAVRAPLRHGLGSIAAGGLGMLLGGWADTTFRGVPSCHEVPGFGLGTVGMITGCTLACLWICAQDLDRSVGRGPWLRALFDPRFHGVVIVAMLLGEEVARAAALLVGQVADHWTLVGGMALGTSIGAVLGGLWVPRGRFGSRLHELPST